MRPFFQEETVVQATGAVGEVRASGYILALVLLAVCTWRARSLNLHTLIHRAGVAIPAAHCGVWGVAHCRPLAQDSTQSLL